MDKKELRNEILKLRNELTLEERNEKSNRIAKRIIEMNEFQTSNVVLLYNEIRSEVETAEIAESAKRLGKRIYVPRVIGEKMDFYLADDMTEYETSRFGIRKSARPCKYLS